MKVPVINTGKTQEKAGLIGRGKKGHNQEFKLGTH